MCVEHHHDAYKLLREVAEFRRERCDESREVPLFVGAEAAGPVNPLQVQLIELRPLPLVSCGLRGAWVLTKKLYSSLELT